MAPGFLGLPARDRAVGRGPPLGLGRPESSPAWFSQMRQHKELRNGSLFQSNVLTTRRDSL